MLKRIEKFEKAFVMQLDDPNYEKYLKWGYNGAGDERNEVRNNKWNDQKNFGLSNNNVSNFCEEVKDGRKNNKVL